MTKRNNYGGQSKRAKPRKLRPKQMPSIEKASGVEERVRSELLSSIYHQLNSADSRVTVRIRQNSVKRQRTTSGTPSSPPNPNRHSASLAAESDNEDGNNRGSGNGASKRIRGAAARNHRERELRERDKDKDRERADAAGRRKGRVERRKGDGKQNEMFGSFGCGLLTDFQTRTRRTNIRNLILPR